ncbi:hypothetical protein QUV80_12855, partial [Paraclostridium benzoelyticum]|nr:hypothetical protein [Paraclostridium benzoelyticum]
MKKEKFRDKNIIVVLFLAIVGLVALFLSECMNVGFWKNIVNQVSLAILISGILGIINEYILKETLVELILDKLRIKSEVDTTGLEEILAGITEINYKNYFKKAKKHVDIVHIYGRTWTNNNIDEIMDRIMASNCKVRVVLVDPESPFVHGLENHFDYKEGEIKRHIEEVTSIWKEKYKKIEKTQSSGKRKPKNLGKIELYYQKGQPTNAMYGVDDRIIVIQTKTTKEKTTRLPAMI